MTCILCGSYPTSERHHLYCDACYDSMQRPVEMLTDSAIEDIFTRIYINKRRELERNDKSN